MTTIPRTLEDWTQDFQSVDQRLIKEGQIILLSSLTVFNLLPIVNKIINKQTNNDPLTVVTASFISAIVMNNNKVHDAHEHDYGWLTVRQYIGYINFMKLTVTWFYGHFLVWPYKVLHGTLLHHMMMACPNNKRLR